MFQPSAPLSDVANAPVDMSEDAEWRRQPLLVEGLLNQTVQVEKPHLVRHCLRLLVRLTEIPAQGISPLSSEYDFVALVNILSRVRESKVDNKLRQGKMAQGKTRLYR